MNTQEMKLRAKLAKNILTAKNFIVITDTKGAMGLSIEKSETNSIGIALQRAALARYRGIVDDQINEFDSWVERTFGSKVVKNAKRKKQAPKGKKIEVTQG